MGLENNFLSNGSLYGAGFGGTSANLQSERDVIIGNLKQSKLHDEYSINGTPNILGKPSPSILDLGGVNPSGPLKDGAVASINNSFHCGEYKNCAPAGSHI